MHIVAFAVSRSNTSHNSRARRVPSQPDAGSQPLPKACGECAILDDRRAPWRFRQQRGLALPTYSKSDNGFIHQPARCMTHSDMQKFALEMVGRSIDDGENSNAHIASELSTSVQLHTGV